MIITHQNIYKIANNSEDKYSEEQMLLTIKNILWKDWYFNSKEIILNNNYC